MFKFHPLGCKIQLLEPDFVKIFANSAAITQNFYFLRTQNLPVRQAGLNFSLSKTNFKHTLNYFRRNNFHEFDKSNYIKSYKVDLINEDW